MMKKLITILVFLTFGIYTIQCIDPVKKKEIEIKTVNINIDKKSRKDIYYANININISKRKEITV